jgi:hypothetical protein
LYGQDCPYSTFSFHLSHFTDVWDPYVRVFFNLPPYLPCSAGARAARRRAPPGRFSTIHPFPAALDGRPAVLSGAGGGIGGDETPRIGGMLRSVELRRREIKPATEGATGRVDSSHLQGPREAATELRRAVSSSRWQCVPRWRGYCIARRRREEQAAAAWSLGGRASPRAPSGTVAQMSGPTVSLPPHAPAGADGQAQCARAIGWAAAAGPADSSTLPESCGEHWSCSEKKREREVEDDTYYWAPHVIGRREGKRGQNGACVIQVLLCACKWA